MSQNIEPVELIISIVLITIVIVGVYSIFFDDNIPEPTRRVTCDDGCYWITLDDSTRCRVFRGEHIPNRDWPMLCEVNGRTVPYQDYLIARDEVD